MALFGKTKKLEPTTHQKIETVYNILKRKGTDAIDAFKQRLATSQGITAHGLFFSSDIIQAAVDKLERFDENEENRPNRIRSQRDSSKKDADFFGGNLDDEVDESIKGESIFEDLWRIRMETLGHRDLASEPLRLGLAPRSIKTSFSSHGSPKNTANRSMYISPADHGKYFRVITLKKIPILKDSNIKLKAIAYMNRGEVFAASEILTSQKDGRVYVCLENGRGWVCATSRADIAKMVIEAIGKQEYDCLNFDEDAQLRAGGCMRDVTSQVQRVQVGQGTVSPIKRIPEEVAHDATPSKKRITSKPSAKFGSPPMFDINATPRRKLDLD